MPKCPEQSTAAIVTGFSTPDGCPIDNYLRVHPNFSCVAALVAGDTPYSLHGLDASAGFVTKEYHMQQVQKPLPDKVRHSTGGMSAHHY